MPLKLKTMTLEAFVNEYLHFLKQDVRKIESMASDQVDAGQDLLYIVGDEEITIPRGSIEEYFSKKAEKEFWPQKDPVAHAEAVKKRLGRPKKENFDLAVEEKE